MARREISAGCVVYRQTDDSVEVALIQPRDRDAIEAVRALQRLDVHVVRRQHARDADHASGLQDAVHHRPHRPPAAVPERQKLRLHARARDHRRWYPHKRLANKTEQPRQIGPGGCRGDTNGAGLRRFHRGDACVGTWAVILALGLPGGQARHLDRRPSMQACHRRRRPPT